MAMVNYNCFNCGAELTFNPETQRWDCAYCGESFSLEDFENGSRQSRTPKKPMRRTKPGRRPRPPTIRPAIW